MAVKPKPNRTRKTTTTPAPGARLAQVPPQEMLDGYIQRNIVPGKTEFDVFDAARERKFNVLIEGPTGPGKTSAVMAYAARENMPFYAVPSNIGIEPSQLFGKYIPNTEGGFKWVDGPVTDIVRHGGVLLLNEVNFIPERVATVLFGLLDKRRQITLLDHEAETIDASGCDLLIIADMNPDYEGTRPLNKAFRNRFAIQLWWDYDDKVEAKLVKCAALRDMAKKLRAEQAAGTYETPCSTNMLIEFEDVFDALGWDFAKANFVNHFESESRQAVGVVVETYRANIEKALSPKGKGKASEPEDEETEAPGAGPDPDNLEDWVDETRGQYIDVVNGKKTIVDPEWGVMGEQWVWDADDE